jgi:Domain of unknown function (DUF4082)/Bacterial Ig-like domain
VGRQQTSLAQKIQTRLVGTFLVWRWRAFLAVALLLFTAMPLALIINQRLASALPCACTVFSTPTGHSNFDDGSDLELGFKFRSSVDGYIRGLRFYKQGPMSGTHTGTLWTSGGSPLASATFTETASGWQEVSFSSPVAITASTLYVASVSMTDGRYVATASYFVSDVTNGPLTAPSSVSVSGNGVFNTSAGAFPATNGNGANYWVDVSFFDTTAPTVTATTPTAGATNVEPADTISATFDQSMDASTLTSSTVSIKDSSNNAVSGALSYDSTLKKLSFVPSSGFTLGETYTATIEGGAGTVAKNAVGLAVANDYSWSFTITATDPCPCTLKDRINPAGSGSFDEAGGVELGVKVKPTTNGYITALRFYKPIISTETTHTGRIWSSTGTQLASATFSNETDYGWQEAKLGTPLQVTENQLYIMSYGTSTAVYQSLAGGLNSNLGSGYLVAHADNSAENAATGSGNRNGVFTGTAGNYPSSGSSNGSYYWIDAVFSVDSTPDYPLEVAVTQPTDNAIGVGRGQVITAGFNRQLDGATVTNSTFRLFDSSNAQVSGIGSYSTAKGLATFTPTSQLAHGQRYTARLSATIADPGGTTLGAEHSWSFTVGSALASDPGQGPGGRLLVITSTTNKYSPYYAEILRTEGFNYFAVSDIASLTTTTLNNYDAAILAEMSLSQAQADMLNNWVAGGGNLVAMRPDAKLSSLLGLTAAGTTRSNQYLLINTATTPGDGLVGETIQFKGTADNYSLSGATAIATLYSDASTVTSNPAVTKRSVGSSGGTAAAFTYDLAKSVIGLHQGNQAWAGDERDGTAPRRPNDLFFGNDLGDPQPDWVDLNKFHIPQADEQQRLLANILIEAVKDKRPLPRFWYLPGDHKAAMVMAGDDHGRDNATGTEITMSDWLNESTTNCSILDWECIRASHYLYESSALTNTRAAQYHNLSFDIGDHVSNGCANFASYAALGALYTSDLNTWRAKYSSIPNQVSHRFHCYVWSDWDSQARVDQDNGIRYDLNYVPLPGTWFGTRAPLMTGSGMNMRLTDADGDMLNVHQGVTNFDDQSVNATNINALLDNAIGASGYYGIFGTHYDMSNVFDTTLYTAAKARNVPMISSAQALTWLDGRNSSTFSNFGGSNGQFTFDVAAAIGANQLKAMLPTQDNAGTLSTLTRGGSTVSYDTRTVKGVQYAVFTATPGSYTATYSDYDPNAGGGGSGGSGGGSNSGSGGSSGSSNKPSTTTPATEEPEIPAETPESGEESSPNKEKELVTPAKTESNNWWWVLVGGTGVFMLGGLAWWLVAALRRHKSTPTL